MGFVLSFIKIKDYPQHRQVCLTIPIIQQQRHLIVAIVLLEHTQSTLTTFHGQHHVKWQQKC